MQFKKYFVGNSLFLAMFDKNKFVNTLYYNGMTGFGGNREIVTKKGALSKNVKSGWPIFKQQLLLFKSDTELNLISHLQEYLQENKIKYLDIVERQSY